jgi:hypothetical protein
MSVAGTVLLRVCAGDEVAQSWLCVRATHGALHVDAAKQAHWDALSSGANRVTCCLHAETSALTKQVAFCHVQYCARTGTHSEYLAAPGYCLMTSLVMFVKTYLKTTSFLVAEDKGRRLSATHAACLHSVQCTHVAWQSIQKS